MLARPYLNQKAIREIVRLVQDGKTDVEIASHMGVTGKKRGPSPKPLTAERRGAIEAAFRAGLTLKEARESAKAKMSDVREIYKELDKQRPKGEDRFIPIEI